MPINILRFERINPIASYIGAYNLLRAESIRTGVEIPLLPVDLTQRLKKLKKYQAPIKEWDKCDESERPLMELSEFIQEKITWLSSRTKYYVPIEERDFTGEVDIFTLYMVDIIESDVAAMNSLYGMLRAVV